MSALRRFKPTWCRLPTIADVQAKSHLPGMTWDLRSSLLKKEERESARLADFEFKLRARTFRLLALNLGTDAAEVVSLIALGDDEAVLRELAGCFPDKAATLSNLYGRCRSEARAQLISEEGDPSAYRLA